MGHPDLVDPIFERQLATMRSWDGENEARELEYLLGMPVRDASFPDRERAMIERLIYKRMTPMAAKLMGTFEPWMDPSELVDLP